MGEQKVDRFQAVIAYRPAERGAAAQAQTLAASQRMAADGELKP